MARMHLHGLLDFTSWLEPSGGVKKKRTNNLKSLALFMIRSPLFNQPIVHLGFFDKEEVISSDLLEHIQGILYFYHSI